MIGVLAVGLAAAAFAGFNRPDGGFVEREAYMVCLDNDGIDHTARGSGDCKDTPSEPDQPEWVKPALAAATANTHRAAHPLHPFLIIFRASIGVTGRKSPGSDLSWNTA